MGKGNVAVRQFMKNKRRFADLFNVKLFQGRQVVLPEELEEVDSESDVLLEAKDGKTKSVQRYRDVVMRWKGCMDLVILACENQAKVHYAMPVRNMLYDSLSYTEQIKQLWDMHQGEEQEITPEEYLSRFRKEDKIFPVITLVWYYGSEPWDGSLDLYEMFPLDRNQEMNRVLKKYVPNYHINLVDADSIEDVNRFQTDLQQIFGMLKCKRDRKNLRKYMSENKDYFHYVDKETYFVIGELLQSKRILEQSVKRYDKEGPAKMYDVIEEIYQDGIERGIEGVIETYQELGKSKADTISKIMEKFQEDLTQEKATALVEKYWK